MSSPKVPMDQHDAGPLREVMSRFPTGVTVVAACVPESVPWGLTVNSLTSVSLDPPLVLVCIQREATSHQKLVDADRFGVSILAAHQARVARRFSSEPAEGRFDEVAWRVAEGGSPVLDEAAAWLECSIEQVLPGGDHSILVGRVLSSGTSEKEALLFYAGDYGAAR